MGSGGDNQLPADRVTKPVRVYRGDEAMIMRMARTRSAATNRRVTAADVIHALLAPVRKAEQERGQ